jgi:hypothetical protein
MRSFLNFAVVAAMAVVLTGTAEAAKRRAPASKPAASTSSSNGARAASAFDADPSRASGNYPDWARRAFASRGGPGR